MSYKDFMNKVRQWDNLTAKWIVRHVYFMFFQIFLVTIFFAWFVNLFNVIDTNYQVPHDNLTERLLSTQSTNITIITLLLFLNSFWLLFIFNMMIRFMNLLKDISFSLNRLRARNPRDR